MINAKPTAPHDRSSVPDKIRQRFAPGNSAGHTFRGDLQQLLESLLPGIGVTNEPKRQRYGAPAKCLTAAAPPD
ncbi:MAG: hypothetical protein EOO11_15420 [Chitinophagaceae bacterium]|nr:MAG: hypothetical protein EOO11_15420 [Chitinophagaceae bacterium]